jgi:TonB family protein
MFKSSINHMTHFKKWPLVIGSILFLHAALAFAVSEKSKQIPFHVDVTFTPDGKPVFGNIIGLPAVLENQTRTLLSQLTIHPGETSASQHERRAILNANLLLMETGDDVLLKVENPSFFPTNIWKGERMAIRYPVSMARAGRSGMSAVHVRIAPDGYVMEAKSIESSHPDFEKSALQAIRHWKYDTSTMTGETSGTVVIRFQIGSDGVPEYTCSTDQSGPSVEGQRQCLTEIDVTSSLLKRSVTVTGN